MQKLQQKINKRLSYHRGTACQRHILLALYSNYSMSLECTVFMAFTFEKYWELEPKLGVIQDHWK